MTGGEGEEEEDKKRSERHAQTGVRQAPPHCTYKHEM